MRPALINALFAIAALATPACAILQRASTFDYSWYPAAPSMEPLWVEVPVAAIRAICDGDHALRHRACVRRYWPTQTCFVFAVAERDEFSEDDIHHEEQKHCREGLNHE